MIIIGLCVILLLVLILPFSFKKVEHNLDELASPIPITLAVLTPIGEPLSTIAIAKLKSWPDVNFWYLARLLGIEVFGGILALSIVSLFFHGKYAQSGLSASPREEAYLQIILRAGRVYLLKYPEYYCRLQTQDQKQGMGKVRASARICLDVSLFLRS